MSRVERVAAHVGQIHALLQCIINECDAAQTEVFDYLYMSDAANEQSEKIKAENAKLRELAATAWWIAENLCQAFDGSCESCPHGGRDDRCVYEKIQRDLLDMGVEVES